MNGVAFTLNSRGDLEFIGNGEKPQDEFVKLLERKEEAIKIQYDEQSDRPLSIADMNRDDKLLDESAKRKYKEALKYNHVASMSRHFTTVTHIDIVLHPFLYDLKIVPIKPINVFERELDKDAIKFEYVKETGKIKIVTASPILDFACSPTLLKALGFDIRDSWIYSIAALEKRISYRDLLVEIYLPKISNRRINEWKQLYDTLKENITEPLGDFFTKQQKSKKKPSGRFNEGKVYENIFNISPFKFQREIQKAYTNSHHGQFWTTSFIPKQFYEFVLKELNGMNEVPLLDAIVTIMLKQTPFPFYIPKGEANIHTIGCIFVNTNIIDPEYINNERLRILDIIPCRVHETKAAFIEKYEASTIHYKPVSSVNLSEIEFQLSTALGESVPFRQGPVMVQLHFRKR
jgi:hypothetical protein